METFYLNGDDIRLSVWKAHVSSRAGLRAVERIKKMASGWHGNRSQVCLHVCI